LRKKYKVSETAPPTDSTKEPFAMQDFHKLNVWHKSHQLTLNVYLATRRFPKDELYGLTSQTRRAAASIPANIAEGCGRDGGADLARFLQIAIGSASELEYHLLLAHDLEFLNEIDWQELSRSVCEVKQMLASFIQKVRLTEAPRHHRKPSLSPKTDN
jgi:four helix bundle protein